MHACSIQSYCPPACSKPAISDFILQHAWSDAWSRLTDEAIVMKSQAKQCMHAPAVRTWCSRVFLIKTPKIQSSIHNFYILLLYSHLLQLHMYRDGLHGGGDWLCIGRGAVISSHAALFAHHIILFPCIYILHAEFLYTFNHAWMHAFVTRTWTHLETVPNVPLLEYAEPLSCIRVNTLLFWLMQSAASR